MYFGKRILLCPGCSSSLLYHENHFEKIDDQEYSMDIRCCSCNNIYDLEYNLKDKTLSIYTVNNTVTIYDIFTFEEKQKGGENINKFYLNENKSVNGSISIKNKSFSFEIANNGSSEKPAPFMAIEHKLEPKKRIKKEDYFNAVMFISMYHLYKFYKIVICDDCEYDFKNDIQSLFDFLDFNLQKISDIELYNDTLKVIKKIKYDYKFKHKDNTTNLPGDLSELPEIVIGKGE